nr:hypothetical protein [Tanacetum cinerariifolium]
MDVDGFVDADYAKDLEKGRSIIGYMCMVHGYVVDSKNLFDRVSNLSVGSSNTDVLDSPCLLVLITRTSQSRQHGLTYAIRARDLDKDRAYAELERMCNKALQDLDKNLLVSDMRAEIKALQGQVDGLYSEYGIHQDLMTKSSTTWCGFLLHNFVVYFNDI